MGLTSNGSEEAFRICEHLWWGPGAPGDAEQLVSGGASPAVSPRARESGGALNCTPPSSAQLPAPVRAARRWGARKEEALGPRAPQREPGAGEPQVRRSGSLAPTPGLLRSPAARAPERTGYPAPFCHSFLARPGREEGGGPQACLGTRGPLCSRDSSAAFALFDSL